MNILHDAFNFDAPRLAFFVLHAAAWAVALYFLRKDSQDEKKGEPRP